MPSCRPLRTKEFPYERFFRNTDDVLIVNTLSDLSPYLSGTEYVLPGKLVIMLATIDIGSDTVRMSANTVLWGAAKGAFVSTTAGALLNCSGLTSPVIVREINLIAPAGSAVDLSGPIDKQLNLFFVGMFAASAGTISGFEVQSVKQCFIDCANGLRNEGTTRKVFYSETPFYSITGSAITLAANLTAEVVDITTSFFKFDSPGIGITAESGYTVGDGMLRGSLIDGTAVPLSGLTPADVNWTMTQNTGIRDSEIAGVAYLDTTTTVTISTANTYEQVAGPFVLAAVSERFQLNQAASQLEYTGRYPSLSSAIITITIDPANNDRIALRVTVNGVGVTESKTIVEQGAGPGSSPRPATVAALVRIENGDVIGLEAANLDTTGNFTLLTTTMTVRG